MIFWLSVFMAINAVRIAGIVMDRRAVELNEDEAELHETVFRNFSAVEFMKLMRIGEWRHAETGECLVAEGGVIGGLMLLSNGEVVVEQDGREINRARDGALIGEISFIQGGAGTATVTATNPCRYVFWPGEELSKLLHRNPSMDFVMKHVFSVALIQKLTAKCRGSEVRHIAPGCHPGLLSRGPLPVNRVRDLRQWAPAQEAGVTL